MGCIKKSYHVEEARREVESLRISSPELLWSVEACAKCDSFHVKRTYPPGYVSEEARKSIKYWREKQRP
jgi:hypothetical protein